MDFVSLQQILQHGYLNFFLEKWRRERNERRRDSNNRNGESINVLFDRSDTQ